MAVMLLWDVLGAVTTDECEGPVRVECSGLIAPGGSWIYGSESLAEVASAVVYGVDATRPAEAGSDASFADALCESLWLTALDDCSQYLAFKRVWDEGFGTYAGLTFDPSVSVPLGATVDRNCASRNAEGDEKTAYRGIAGHRAGVWDDEQKAFVYDLPFIMVNTVGMDSRISLQNMGLEPADVELSVAAAGQCGHRQVCGRWQIQPGESKRIEPSNASCQQEKLLGSAMLRSSQALASVVEVSGRGVRMAYTGQPALGSITESIDGRPQPHSDSRSHTLFGPATQSKEAGWDVGVHVQNQSLDRDAWVELSFLDDQGVALESFDARICAGNSAIYFQSVLQADHADRAGGIRVTSRPLPSRAWEPAAPIAAVSFGIRYSDAARTESVEAYAYALLPENHVGPWPLGGDPREQPAELEDAAEAARGTAILALPGLVYDPAGDAGASTIQIGNLVGLPGRTDVEVFILNQNRVVATHSLALQAGQHKRIDLGGLGLQPGFRGNAIVSASYWDHALLGPLGSGEPVVGLAGAMITRISDSSPGGAAGSLVLGEALKRLPKMQSETVLPFRTYLPALRMNE